MQMLMVTEILRFLCRRGSVNNHNWYGLVSNVNIDNGGPLTYNFGDGRTYTGDHFRQVVDWFGLNGWLIPMVQHDQVIM